MLTVNLKWTKIKQKLEVEKVENLATKSGEEGVQLGLAQNPENHATTDTHWNYQMRKSNAGTTQNQQFTHHS